MPNAAPGRLQACGRTKKWGHAADFVVSSLYMTILFFVHVTTGVKFSIVCNHFI